MEIREALFEIQKKGLSLTKDATNPHFGNTYATLGAVLEVVVPELTERGVLLSQQPCVVGEVGPVLRTSLTDTDSKEGLTFDTPLILDKTTMQGLGSAITYARRYALVSLFNLDAEDDDGNEASGKTAKAESTPRRVAPARRRS
jgi:hypothetical protein